MFEFIDPRRNGFKLLAGEFDHVGFGSRIFDHLPEVVALVPCALKGLDRSHERVQFGELLRELHERLVIYSRRRAESEAFPTG